MTMKAPPTGYTRMSASVFYDDPKAAIAFLRAAFGFELRLLAESDDGVVQYSELVFGDAVFSVGGTGVKDPNRETWQKNQKSPKGLAGANTQSLCFFVDDADTHCEVARKAGAVIFREPKTDDYGDDYWSDRTYGATDPEGHVWFFMQRLKTGKG